jgi:sugar O-acyltransferase (sialic acid O-acetyltransferase NeuD family)
MIRLVLAGNAVTAEILLAYLNKDQRYQVAGLTVDDEFVASGVVDSMQTTPMSQLRATFPPDDYRILMAVGYGDLNRIRESLFRRLKEMGYAVETYVHPQAHVHTENPLGEGSIVLPGAVVEPHAAVGANTMVWCNVVLAHHCQVGDHCWLAGGAVVAGQASIGDNSFVGVNATIVNKVSVAARNVIGASALITRDTKPSTVHLARSAEPFRYSSEEYVKHSFGT